jgi:hypothetical protein
MGGQTKIVEWLTAAGVIASLLFVGVQIRQNTAALQAASYQALADQAMDLNLTVATNPDLASAYAVFRGEPGGPDQQVRSLVMAYVRAVENAYYLTKLGTFDARQLRRMTSNSLYAAPNFVLFWERNGRRFDPDFRAFMDSVMQNAAAPVTTQ